MVETLSFKLWLTCVTILSGLLAFFLWLGIRPRSPSYTITDFSVQGGVIDFGLEVQNPNKDSRIYFDDINVTCCNNQENIGSTNLSHFSQDKGDTTPIPGKIIVDVKLWKAVEDQISKRKAQLQVVLVTRIQYRTWGIKSRHHRMKLNGQLPIGPDGKVPGKAKLRTGSKKWRMRLT